MLIKLSFVQYYLLIYCDMTPHRKTINVKTCPFFDNFSVSQTLKNDFSVSKPKINWIDVLNLTFLDETCISRNHQNDENESRPSAICRAPHHISYAIETISHWICIGMCWECFCGHTQIMRNMNMLRWESNSFRRNTIEMQRSSFKYVSIWSAKNQRTSNTTLFCWVTNDSPSTKETQKKQNSCYNVIFISSAIVVLRLHWKVNSPLFLNADREQETEITHSSQQRLFLEGFSSRSTFVPFHSPKLLQTIWNNTVPSVKMPLELANKREPIRPKELHQMIVIVVHRRNHSQIQCQYHPPWFHSAIEFVAN